MRMRLISNNATLTSCWQIKSNFEKMRECNIHTKNKTSNISEHVIMLTVFIFFSVPYVHGFFYSTEFSDFLTQQLWNLLHLWISLGSDCAGATENQ